MMAEDTELQTAKGMRDVPPEELLIRQEAVEKLVRLFERYGFNPLETPLLERWDILSAKFGAGADSDAMREVFRLVDQGGRELGLRFELTLSMARFVAMNPQLKLPFKRYEIGRVYRDGPIKLGRSREFTQCDVDIVGSADVIADAELVKLSLDAFRELGLDSYVEVNSRKLLNAILEQAGVQQEKRMAAIIIIDKLGKIGQDGVEEELGKLGVTAEESEAILRLFGVKGSSEEKISALRQLLKAKTASEALDEVEGFLCYFSPDEKRNVVFTPSLARGLGYYTGMVFEGFLRDSEFKGSICGGGRYDEMIGLLVKSNQKMPATGISFGLVPIMEALKAAGGQGKKTVTSAFVIPIGDTRKEALAVCQELRSAGINTDIDLMSRSISKNLAYADTLGIAWVVFVGKKELSSGVVKLRDMRSGGEELLGVREAAERISKEAMP